MISQPKQMQRLADPSRRQREREMAERRRRIIEAMGGFQAGRRLRMKKGRLLP
jgi:hypothetical protein